MAERIARSPPVSLAEGIGIALQLAAAITDLARADVIHRDIKPENVMLLTGGQLVLLDLGLAALQASDAADAGAGGTMRYMAPELFRGQPATARSEVYALAITLYRVFTGGAFPFGQGEAIPLARKRPDLPVWLGRAIGRCLDNDVTKRFADAGEFARALEHGLATEETTGRAAGSAKTLAEWVGQLPPVRLWQGICALLALISFILLLGGKH